MLIIALGALAFGGVFLVLGGGEILLGLLGMLIHRK